tara:strand:+ start:663 stop:938 length:276 start_codon:yes stop_codon:yes gene_type:complete
MENTPNNNLISDVCDKIASGYDFGGWTDPLDERVLGRNEVRAINKINKNKFRDKVKSQRRDQREIDNSNKNARIERVKARYKDDQLNPRNR